MLKLLYAPDSPWSERPLSGIPMTAHAEEDVGKGTFHTAAGSVK